MKESPKGREDRLAWMLENALSYIRALPQNQQAPDMGACWLFAHGEYLLGDERPDVKKWEFEWRYDGS